MKEYKLVTAATGVDFEAEINEAAERGFTIKHFHVQSVNCDSWYVAVMERELS